MKDTKWFRTLFTLGGALLGATVGHFVFNWLANNQGLIGYAIPGGLAAMASGLNPKCPSRLVAILCGVLAFFAGNFTLWKRVDFIADGSFSYALTHFFDRNPAAWGLILLSTALAIWIPWRRVANGRLI